MFARLKSLRTHFFPIQREDVKKFVPLFVIFFFVGFVYNILRNAKDALLITGQASGAEIIPFVKLWVMLPGALVMTAVFSWLSNKLTMEKVFYALVSFFLVYFLIFAFILYPNSESLHLHKLGSFLSNHLPPGFAGFISMIRYWSFTLFYVMCELWSCIVLSILFWGFANEITSVGEATRYYGLLGIGMNFSGIAAGHATICLSRMPQNGLGQPTFDPWQLTLILITVVIFISGLIIVGAFRWIHKNVLDHCKYYKSKEKNNFKLSLRKNFSYLAKSKYLICIAILVLSFNLVINLVEILWKDQVRQLYPDPNNFIIYLNKVTIATGIIATAVALFSGIIIRKFGWSRAAAITPLTLLFTSIGFFACLLFKPALGGFLISKLGIAPISLIVFFGSMQICLSRACKYTLFDATKELSFVPLTPESRQKGKAAIDGVGSRLGKSGGSVIHQGLLMICSSFAMSAPIVAVFLLFVIGVWLFSVKVLGKEFTLLTTSHESLDIDETAPQPISGLTQEQVV